MKKLPSASRQVSLQPVERGVPLQGTLKMATLIVRQECDYALSKHEGLCC